MPPAQVKVSECSQSVPSRQRLCLVCVNITKTWMNSASIYTCQGPIEKIQCFLGGGWGYPSKSVELVCVMKHFPSDFGGL